MPDVVGRLRVLMDSQIMRELQPKFVYPKLRRKFERAEAYSHSRKQDKVYDLISILIDTASSPSYVEEERVGLVCTLIAQFLAFKQFNWKVRETNKTIFSGL